MTKFQHDVRLETVTVTIQVIEHAEATREVFKFKIGQVEHAIGNYAVAKDMLDGLTEALAKYQQYREVILGEPNELQQIMRRRV